jgi:hypothetical protein
VRVGVKSVVRQSKGLLKLADARACRSGGRMPTGSDGAPPSCPGSALVPVSSTVRHEVERPVRILLRKRFASTPSDQRVLLSNPVQNSHNDKAVLALSLEEGCMCASLFCRTGTSGRALAGGGAGFDVPALSSSDVAMRRGLL